MSDAFFPETFLGTGGSFRSCANPWPRSTSLKRNCVLIAMMRRIRPAGSAHVSYQRKT